MLRFFFAAVLASGLLICRDGLSPSRAQEARPTAQNTAATGAERLKQLLVTERVKYAKDLRTTPLAEVLADLAKDHKISFAISSTAFVKPVVEQQCFRVSQRHSLKDYPTFSMYFITRK